MLDSDTMRSIIPWHLYICLYFARTYIHFTSYPEAVD